MNKVDIVCPGCLGQPLPEFPYVCKQCWGHGKVRGYTAAMVQELRDAATAGKTIQYDDTRDCCWIDISMDRLDWVLANSINYWLRIKPDPTIAEVFVKQPLELQEEMVTQWFGNKMFSLIGDSSSVAEKLAKVDALRTHALLATLSKDNQKETHELLNKLVDLIGEVDDA